MAYIGTPQTTNALSRIAGMRQTDNQNALMQRNREQERNDRLAQQEISNRMGALGLALDAKTAEDAGNIYKEAIGEDAKFNFTGKDISIDLGDGTIIEGPQKYIKEFMENVSSDPSWFTDPEKQPHLRAWAAAKGISIKKGKKEDAGFTLSEGQTRYDKEGNLLVSAPGKTETPKVGSTRTYQKDDQSITEEYTKDGWKELGKGPKFKPDTSSTDKATKDSYDKMKRIETVLGEVKKEISLFADTNFEDLTENQKNTLLKNIEAISEDPKMSERHRKLADEYLMLVDELYKKPASSGPSWKDYR